MENIRITSTDLSRGHDECSICVDDFEIGAAALRLPCRHLFHVNCIELWLSDSDICPMCRQSVWDEPLPQQLTTDLGPEQNECTICMDDLETELAGRRLPCNHIFHTNCIEMWLRGSDTCPTCRQSAWEEPLPQQPVTDLSHERDECPICMDDLENGSAGRRLPCNHLFHTNCIGVWLNDKNTCPICRRSVWEEPLPQQPVNNAQQQHSGYQQPVNDNQPRVNDNQQRGNNNQQPANGTQQQNNGYQPHGNNNQQDGNATQQTEYRGMHRVYPHRIYLPRGEDENDLGEIFARAEMLGDNPPYTVRGDRNPFYRGNDQHLFDPNSPHGNNPPFYYLDSPPQTRYQARPARQEANSRPSTSGTRNQPRGDIGNQRPTRNPVHTTRQEANIRSTSNGTRDPSQRSDNRQGGTDNQPPPRPQAQPLVRNYAAEAFANWRPTSNYARDRAQQIANQQGDTDNQSPNRPQEREEEARRAAERQKKIDAMLRRIKAEKEQKAAEENRRRNNPPNQPQGAQQGAERVHRVRLSDENQAQLDEKNRRAQEHLDQLMADLRERYCRAHGIEEGVMQHGLPYGPDDEAFIQGFWRSIELLRAGDQRLTDPIDPNSRRRNNQPLSPPRPQVRSAHREANIRPSTDDAWYQPREPIENQLQTRPQARPVRQEASLRSSSWNPSQRSNNRQGNTNTQLPARPQERGKETRRTDMLGSNIPSAVHGNLPDVSFSLSPNPQHRTWVHQLRVNAEREEREEMARRRAEYQRKIEAGEVDINDWRPRDNDNESLFAWSKRLREAGIDVREAQRMLPRDNSPDPRDGY